jgi:hypothetical protein
MNDAAALKDIDSHKQVITFQVSCTVYVAEEIDLNDMLYAEGARFDPGTVCLPHS